MTTIRLAFALFLGLACSAGPAYASGESSEPTPESIDAAFSAQDAARVAAGFSTGIAVDSIRDPLGTMAAEADMVFLGTVTAQSYHYDERGTPSTHTTFSVSLHLKGDQVANELALVQPGGPSQSGDRVMMVSDAKHFNVGEEEILFVGLDAQNPVAALRFQVLNRFRVFEDRVYDDDGYGVNVESLGGGAFGLILSNSRSPAERFQRIHIGSHWLEKHFPREGAGTPDSSHGSAGAGSARGHQRGQATAIDVDTFGALIATAGE